MAVLKDEIALVAQIFQEEISRVQDGIELEQLRVRFVGRQGKINELMGLLKSASLEEKRECGPSLNQLKQEIEKALADKQLFFERALSDNQDKRAGLFDVTAYRHESLQGSRHVYTLIIEQLEDIFISMGYEIATGPELETDYHNFTALNIPLHHPARDMQDTFWMHLPHMLLRTQTSSVQIRAMETKGVPLAIFAPGRVYRNEQVDASHAFMFTQGEGLVVDKNISVGNLIATIKAFLRILFEKKDLQIRVRPGYFPFVEPGLEVDASCPFCSSGCSVCKKTGWIELMGSGLVHPEVLRMSGIDPTIYSGFAFGFGIERLAMIKYGINDIRLFHASSIDFLKQF